MKKERGVVYQDLLHQFQEECLFLAKGDINSRGRLLEQIDDLLERETNFTKMYFAMLGKHRKRLVNVKIARHVTSELLIEELRAFARGKPVDFTDTNLRMLISRFGREPGFRGKVCCDEEPDLYEAFIHWQTEYQWRIEHDDLFASHVLLGKLLVFTPGYPYSEDLAEEILEFLDRLYENPTFQEELHDADKKVHEALAYWLQERQRRSAKKIVDTDFP